MSVLSKKTVYTAKYFKVIQKVVERNGKKFTKDFIEKNAIVVIIPYTDDYEVYMESQFRDALEENMLESVAGTIEDNADPLDTAKRELKEETGFTAKTWKKIAQWQTTSNMQGQIHIFAATDLEAGEQQLDEDEEIEVIKMPLAEVMKKIESGELTIAYQIAAFLLFDRLKKEGEV
jgi:8-oxo-dGTP pyrophosphatase MutT (NUDIX family)